jgi:hypothetical protein
MICILSDLSQIIVFGLKVNTTKEPRLRTQEEVEKGEDTIHVYKDGYKIEYNGVRGNQIIYNHNIHNNAKGPFSAKKCQ